MDVSQLVTENMLDAWVRAHTEAAQGKIVELVARLVAASCPHSTRFRFPLCDSMNQQGPDGELDTATQFLPYVPVGKSIWEIGTGEKPAQKAEEDYQQKTKSIDDETKKQTTFIFVTPLSGRKGWRNTDKQGGIKHWIKAKKAEDKWKDVLVLDGTQLVSWVGGFPAVSFWLAKLIHCSVGNFETAESRWELISTFGKPPRLDTSVFTTGKEAATEKLRQLIIEKTANQLKIITRYPRQIADYVSAYIASLPDDERKKYFSRVLIIPTPDVWRDFCNLNESHIFVADFDLDAESGGHLIQQAMNRRHVVIYSESTGGMPHGNSVELHLPRTEQLKASLIKSGHNEERVRQLTDKCGRNLAVLLRLLRGFSASPGWAEQSESNNLALAQLLGQWVEENRGDQEVAEELSGNEYGEWMNSIRKIANAKATPLEFFNGRWRITSRYEAWIYLGPLIGLKTLDQFEKIAIKVLSETDAELDLPKEDRFAAKIYGKKRYYSSALRNGIAETLALLGAQGKFLTACPNSRPESVATRVVRSLLAGADSTRWVSLNDVLPFLAEAAPDEFLRAVGSASENPDQPFSRVFAEEGDGIFSGNYITGILWALESLAWNGEYLTRVCRILANLDATDPGGKFTNRPINSLTTILLPWLPQTCADPTTRYSAIKCIVREMPEVAWRLVLRLLPRHHSSSAHTHKPKWRDYIPDDWQDGATNHQRWEDEKYYATLALQLADTNLSRLSILIEYYFFLDESFQESYRNKLLSKEIQQLPEEKRYLLWNTLSKLLYDHRRYANRAKWAQPESKLQELEAVAQQLAPKTPEVKYKRLFTGRLFDLDDDTEDWEERQRRIFERRTKAVHEIFDNGGFDQLLAFSRSVESAGDVGMAYGADHGLADDSKVLPSLLESENESDVRFATHYIWARFGSMKWKWVDGLDRSNWVVDTKVKLFSILPFNNETWDRVAKELCDDENVYWKKTNTNLRKDCLQGADNALKKLIVNGRADAAIECLVLDQLKGGVYSEIGLYALEEFNKDNHVDRYDICRIIEILQNSENVDENRLLLLEFKFAGLLDEHSGVRPLTTYRRLSERPNLFSEIIRIIYRPTKKGIKSKSVRNADNVKFAEQAYELIREWNYPPGIARDGSFSPRKLTEWIEAVRAECIASGHWEMACYRIGEVLTHTPLTTDRIWYDEVCSFLDSRENQKARDGFWCKIINSRGVHGFTYGKEEIELAEKWEQFAKVVEEKGFSRFEETLRSIGRHYREEAEHSVIRYQDRFE